MYPVQRHAQQVIDEWAQELAEKFGCSAQEIRARPSHVLRFPIELVRIDLVDGSSVAFKYAFFIVSEANKAIAVFTEHCGHHVFPHHDAKVYRDGTLSYEQGA